MGAAAAAAAAVVVVVVKAWDRKFCSIEFRRVYATSTAKKGRFILFLVRIVF